MVDDNGIAVVFTRVLRLGLSAVVIKAVMQFSRGACLRKWEQFIKSSGNDWHIQEIPK